MFHKETKRQLEPNLRKMSRIELAQRGYRRSNEYLNVSIFFLLFGNWLHSETRRVGMSTDDREAISWLKLLSNGKRDDGRFVLLNVMATAQANIPRVTF